MIVEQPPMRSRVPRKSVDFESIDLGDSLHSYPPGTNPNNLAPYKVTRYSCSSISNNYTASKKASPIFSTIT